MSTGAATGPLIYKVSNANGNARAHQQQLYRQELRAGRRTRAAFGHAFAPPSSDTELAAQSVTVEERGAVRSAPPAQNSNLSAGRYGGVLSRVIFKRIVGADGLRPLAQRGERQLIDVR